MVNEELSAKSLHFMVEKGVKPTARLLLNVLKAYLRHRHAGDSKSKIRH